MGIARLPNEQQPGNTHGIYRLWTRAARQIAASQRWLKPGAWGGRTNSAAT